MSDDEVALGAVCAVHDVAAIRTCARCGNNVCERCLDLEALRDDLCEACRERVGGGAPLPWETTDGPWWRRWLVTARRLVLAPGRTIEGAAAGDWRRALTFVALVGAVGSAAAPPFQAHRAYLAFTAEQGPFALGLMAGVVLSLLAGSLFQVTFATGRAVAFQLAARLAGARPRWRVSLWACGYAHAVYALVPLAHALRLLPALLTGLAVLLGALALEVGVAVSLTRSARVHHRLPPGRAAFAGWAPFLALLVLGGVCLIAITELLLGLAMLPD